LWVFGYGSLMWRPGFPYAQAVGARLRGFRRSYCIYSTHYRGCPEQPGLVVGLDLGGACKGMAFRVSPGHEQPTIDYLRERELIGNVYHESYVRLALQDGAEVRALAFIADRAMPSYACGLTDAEKAKIILTSKGLGGTNLEYFTRTLESLRALGIVDAEMERLAALIDPAAPPAA
jgi:cation transport protein ChaC